MKQRLKIIGDKKQIKNYLAQYAQATKYVLNLLKEKNIQEKSIPLPSNNGLLCFTKIKPNTIQIELISNDYSVLKTNFTQRFKELIADLETETKNTKEKKDNLMQKAFDKKILQQVSYWTDKNLD